MSLTNAYVAYTSYCKMHNIKPMLHRDFISNIVLTWLSHEMYPQGLKLNLEFETPLSADINSEFNNNLTPFSNVSSLTSSMPSKKKTKSQRDHEYDDADYGNDSQERDRSRCSIITKITLTHL